MEDNSEWRCVKTLLLLKTVQLAWRKSGKENSATSKRVSFETFPRIVSFRVHILGRSWTRVMDGRGQYLTKSACKLSWAGRGHADGLWTVAVRVWSLVCEVRPRASRIYGPRYDVDVSPRAESPKADLSHRVSKPRPSHRLPQPGEPECSSSLIHRPDQPMINPLPSSFFRFCVCRNLWIGVFLGRIWNQQMFLVISWFSSSPLCLSIVEICG